MVINSVNINQCVDNQKSELLKRSRWGGVLTNHEIEFCRENNISLAYDCAQIGWLVYNEDEEFAQKVLESNAQDSYEHIKNSITKLKSEFKEELKLALKNSKIMTDRQIIAYSVNLISVLTDRVENRNDIKLLDRVHCVLINEAANIAGVQAQPPKHDFGFSYRAWKRQDLPAYIKIMGNAKVWRYLPDAFPTPLSKDLALSMIEIANVGGNDSIMAVEYRKHIIGQMRLLFNNDYPELRIAEVAYMLDEDYWGKGIMSNLLLDFIHRSFKIYSLDFIYAWIMDDNIASIKCANRAGFLKDNFAYERDLAIDSRRPGFSRYICFRSKNRRPYV